MSRHLSILQKYVTSSERILGVLAKGGVFPVHDEASSASVAAPSLPEHKTFDSELRLHLHSRSLGSSLVEDICDLYRSQCSIWREKVQAEWTKSYARLVSLDGTASTLHLLKEAYVASHSRRLRSMQAHVLQVIDKRLEEYRADSEAAASASSSDQVSETDDDNVRGHGAEAVAILEAAYAYTTNITQAEKRRLAQATGLEPRQVVIWFQNRRNRKVKSRVEGAALGTGNKQASPSAELARKRKVSCNDPAGPRRPSTFVTPEKKARLHDMPPPSIGRRLSSSTSTASLGSSVDSRADSLLSDWVGPQRFGKQRTVSSESAATSYTSPSVCSSFGSTPAAEDCSPWSTVNPQRTSQLSGYSHMRPTSNGSEQGQAFAQRLLGPSAPYAQRQAPPVEIAHIFNDGQQDLSSGNWGASASNLLFSDDSDVPRLDFDDLGLSLADFGKDVSLPFDFSAPPPAGGAQLWQRGAPIGEGLSGMMHSQDLLAPTSTSALHSTRMHDQPVPRPHHITNVAETLNEGDFDLFAALASLPTFQGMSADAIVQFAASGGQDLSLKAEQMHCTPSPSTVGTSTSSSSPREREVVTPPSKVAEADSPEDFGFTFDFAELGLDRTFAEIKQSYRLAEEEAKMYSISEMEDEGCGGASSGSETGPEETQAQQVKRFSSSTIVPESPTPSPLASGPWAIPARPVDLHAQRGTRQAGRRGLAS